MKLHHPAFWTKDIDKLLDFYKKHFNGKLLFTHESGDFKCSFVKICSGIIIELMTRSNLKEAGMDEPVGYSHFSIEVESKDEVNKLTDYFIGQKVPLDKIKEQYDDGFYESSVIDPDGNIIEIAYIDRNINNTV